MRATATELLQNLPNAELELHLNASTDFTRKGWGKKVKAIGGHYSDVRRSSTSTRFVHVPNNEAGRELANQLLQNFKAYKKTTVVVRNRGGWGVPAWVDVQYIPNHDNRIEVAIEGYKQAMQNAVERNIIGA